MISRSTAILLGLSLLGSAGALAQPAPTGQPGRPAAAPARPAAQAPANAAPAAPAAAAAAPAQPAAPQPVRTEIVVHDGWTATCREFADKKKTCTSTLQVVQQQNNQVIFNWIIGKNADNKLLSVLQTPTGVAIAPGVEIKLSRGNPRKAAYANCDANRCESSLEMDDSFIRDATASETVDATVVSNNGQSIKFALPFKGFDKAVAAVR